MCVNVGANVMCGSITEPLSTDVAVVECHCSGCKSQTHTLICTYACVIIGRWFDSDLPSRIKPGT